MLFTTIEGYKGHIEQESLKARKSLRKDYENNLQIIAEREFRAIEKLEDWYPRAQKVAKELEGVQRTLGTLWPNIFLGKGYEVSNLQIVFDMNEYCFLIKGLFHLPIVEKGKVVNILRGPEQWNLQGHNLNVDTRRFNHPKNLPIGENIKCREFCQ